MHFLKALIEESKSYSQLSDLESLVEIKGDLSSLPVQPLYMIFKSSEYEKVAHYLPMLSKEQRAAFLDLDLWIKDHIDIPHFEFWLESYFLVKDEEVLKEFLGSEQFAMYLKSVVNIHTFDVEDPNYPDHDNYFLTDDQLLLIEFHESFPFSDKLQFLIRKIYYFHGVENSYQWIFKTICENFLAFQEDEMQKKTERLRDFGFVDYFDSLNLTASFQTVTQINNFVEKRVSEEAVTGNLDVEQKSQALHLKCLSVFENTSGGLQFELDSMEDDQRKDFLRFNFIKLLNSSLSLNNALKSGSLAVSESMRKCLVNMNLGLSFVVSKNNSEKGKVLDKYTFFELFKIGFSLLGIEKNRLKKMIENTELDKQEKSLRGHRIERFLDASFLDPCKLYDLILGSDSAVIEEHQQWLKWQGINNFLEDISPSIDQVFLHFFDLCESDKVQDHYFRNYDLADVDWECLLITSYFHYKSNGSTEMNSIGITLPVFKDVVGRLVKDGKIEKENLFSNRENQINFYQALGLKPSTILDEYLFELIKESVEGYDFSTMSEEDFQHVGGPLILI